MAGCGDDDDDDGGGADESAALQEVGKGEGQVDLIAWAGCSRDGSTDPAYDWVTPFEKKTGCDVNVKIGNTSDEMVTPVRTGNYDGVSASGDATPRLQQGGDVDPVNDLEGTTRTSSPRSRISLGTPSMASTTASRMAAGRTC